MRERTIRYKGDDITVYFSVDRCTHVAECILGLPQVFDTAKRPWVNTQAASADEIAEVIIKCPTGALHFERKDGGPQETIPEKNTFRVEQDGPLYLWGNLEIRNADGSILIEDTRVAFCRCGHSMFKPLCDGRHDWAEFEDDGTIKGSIPSKEPFASPHGKVIVKLTPNGPLIVKGAFELKNADGDIVFHGDKAAFCRCGASATMPFCDSSHKRIDFKAEDKK